MKFNQDDADKAKPLLNRSSDYKVNKSDFGSTVRGSTFHKGNP